MKCPKCQGGTLRVINIVSSPCGYANHPIFCDGCATCFTMDAAGWDKLDDDEPSQENLRRDDQLTVKMQSDRAAENLISQNFPELKGFRFGS